MYYLNYIIYIKYNSTIYYSLFKGSARTGEGFLKKTATPK